MTRTLRLRGLALLALALICLLRPAVAADNPFQGQWMLTIPGGAPGWLGVEEKEGKLAAAMLWGWGSVTPLDSARLADGKLVLTRQFDAQRAGTPPQKVKLTETITATLDGNAIKLTSSKPRTDGREAATASFSGLRQPPLPPAPDLSKVRFGEPINLFNGRDLQGWRLTESGTVSGWSVKDGLLINDPVQTPGQPHKNYGNLRTDREFEDFRLTLQTRIPTNGNSGIYLRGIYEVQVMDSFGKPLDPHHLGAVYSRIAPTANAEKPAGEWQDMDITFVDRHVTVVVNGKKIIDNQPVLGCTGGALWSDVTKPGPIYFQGDHTGIAYRNIQLRPVLKAAN